MGYDLNRISEEVDEELKCGICHQLLENPMILSECNHIFCLKCLNDWLALYLICPIDQKLITKSQIRCAPKLFHNFITKFKISCDFVDNGCREYVKVDKLVEHLKECQFKANPRSELSKEEDMATSDQLKQLESLELRVKALENENQWIRKQLDSFKSVFGWDSRKAKQSDNCCGKLLIKINDKTLVIDANTKESIKEIKHKVQALENINANEMMVFFANQELDENQTLSDYRINKLSNPLFLSMVKKKINISVKIDREREYKIEVSPKDRIGDLLPKVLRKEVLESYDTLVTYRNQELDESRTLFSCRIRDGNYIFVNTKPRIGL